jgi:transposase-like protein
VLIQQGRLIYGAAPRKYDREFRERAVRMYRDRLAEGNDSKLGAGRHIGTLLDLNPATLRNWVEDAERAEGSRAPSTADRVSDGEEVRALKKRVAELERAREHRCSWQRQWLPRFEDGFDGLITQFLKEIDTLFRIFYEQRSTAFPRAAEDRLIGELCITMSQGVTYTEPAVEASCHVLKRKEPTPAVPRPIWFDVDTHEL